MSFEASVSFGRRNLLHPLALRHFGGKHAADSLSSVL
jgi:hypothetical protein